MRIVLIGCLVSLCVLVSSTTPKNTHQETQDNEHEDFNNQNYLKWHKDILLLFKYIHQRTYFTEHVEIAKDWKIENHLSSFKKHEVVKEFMHYYYAGMLPRDEIFSVFYTEHLKQAIALFKLFYYAKDFETFYKTACWARYYLNQGMFLYSFSVALVHRPDTHEIVLPPIYEIYPYYFFNSKIIQKVRYYKQMWSNAGTGPENGYLIYGNYSGWYFNLHPEQSMSYFTEDIGINSYYYYYNLYRPFWMNKEEYKLISYNRGEEFYFFYQQLLARYYLERLSNDMGKIDIYDYDKPFEDGYYPSLCYPNGLEFPERPNWAHLFSNYYNQYTTTDQLPIGYYFVKDYERRIRDAIDAGYVTTRNGHKIELFKPNGFNILGNIIESNADSINTRYYGYLQIFARHLLGYSLQPLDDYKISPSAMEHFETSARDPAFWMFFKRLILYFQKYKYFLQHYTYDDLAYPGVKIESVEVDNLLTYFDYYDSDITNAMYMNQNEWEDNNLQVHVRQWRLNHKPFTYKIKVISNKLSQAVVRIFIGPKYDEYGRYIHMNENRLNFVEFDRFKYNLKPGINLIKRNSKETFFANDRTTYRQLYRWVMSGVTSKDFMIHKSEIYYGFPNRFLLPKGKYGGQVYQFYVMISPYKENIATVKHQQSTANHTHEQFNYPIVGLGIQYLDNYPLGYPFDRPINERFFYVPNSHFKEVIIYHKHMKYVDNAMWHKNTKGMEVLREISMEQLIKMKNSQNEDVTDMGMQKMESPMSSVFDV